MVPGGRRGVLSITIDGMPLTLSGPFELSQNGPQSGSLFIGRHDQEVATQLEDSRHVRIRRALRCKLPKLRKCAEIGDVTILILENADISLSNHSLIAKAVEAELPAQGFRPDYIFIADTALGDIWDVFCIVQAGNLFVDMEYVERLGP